MSGRKGMRHYDEGTKERLRQEYRAGASVLGLSRKYGISRYAIQGWCGLRPEVTLRQMAPMPRGRRTNKPQSLEKEVRRLRMENEMMRDFLKRFGRR